MTNEHGEAAVLVLAAGAGTRMRSDTPKVLHTLARPQHAVARAARGGQGRPRSTSSWCSAMTATASRPAVAELADELGRPIDDRGAGAAAGHRPRRRAAAWPRCPTDFDGHRRGHLRRRAAAGRRHAGRPDRRAQRRAGRGDRADHDAARPDRLRPDPAHAGRRGHRRSSSRPTPRRRSGPSARSTPASTPSTSPRCARR